MTVTCARIAAFTNVHTTPVLPMGPFHLLYFRQRTVCGVVTLKRLQDAARMPRLTFTAAHPV